MSWRKTYANGFVRASKEIRQYAGDEFFNRLSKSVKNQAVDGKKSDVLVFVHGFNNSFEDAARRTAQLAYDLKYQGVPIFWSWPSESKFVTYAYDETNVRWTEPHLEAFIKQVARNSGAERIHLIAHSMGNRCLTEALKRMGEKIPSNIKEVVLAAPDIDAGTFKEDIAPKIIDSARRVTLYASSRDRALLLSKTLHGGPRAGESGDEIVVMPLMDTIDVSDVDTSFDGHAYYGANTSVLSDIFYVIHDKKPPSERFGMMSAALNGQKYWKFQPQAAR